MSRIETREYKPTAQGMFEREQAYKDRLVKEKAEFDAKVKAEHDARWGRTKKESQPGMNQEQKDAALKAYYAKQDAAHEKKGTDWNAKVQVKKGEAAAIHYATQHGEIEENHLILNGKKKQYDESKLSALKSFESRQEANVRYAQAPYLSESNYVKREDGPTKKELDAKKKAFWHAKNEAERTQIEAFKKATEAKTVATQTASLDQVKVEVTGPKKPTFFEVSAARRNAILEARQVLTAEEKAAKVRENTVENRSKPGFVFNPLTAEEKAKAAENAKQAETRYKDLVESRLRPSM
ncbi:MAG: hypothetical protein A3F13_03380 [Gammaproteobacteria bacterium RIFCSPHIGHO2_12_FULL_40_19]|nr:MAG: hypothetical protein A3F13_03380 [Gammaproteobacteria bacterium RIFCSPHIGHO2_12_FULL_40_19]